MKNNCVITFEGLNVNHFLNGLCRQNITILGVSRRGKQCILQVDAIHSQKVVAQLKEKCYNILDVRYTGVSFAAHFAKKRYILLLCIVLCVAVIAVSSQFCLRIETQGDYSNEEVMQALSKAGVYVGSSLVGFNPDAVENAVANELNAMYAVVKRQGGALYVNVVATKQIDAPIDMSRKRDICATVGGTVISVLCEQGNLLVNAGDYVNVGDVLIEGRRIFNDGQSQDVYALGRIVIRQSVRGLATFNGYKTVMQQTGNVMRNVGVVLFGKEYVNTCKYENFEQNVTYKYLQPLNIALAYNTYYETRQATVSCSIEDCLDELKTQAYETALAQCNFTPIDVEYVVENNTVTAILYTLTDIY